MTTIYILESDWSYDGSNIHGVYSSPEKAFEGAQKLHREYSYNQWNVDAANTVLAWGEDNKNTGHWWCDNQDNAFGDRFTITPYEIDKDVDDIP